MFVNDGSTQNVVPGIFQSDVRSTILFVLGVYSYAKGLRKIAWHRMILKVFGCLRYIEP